MLEKLTGKRARLTVIETGAIVPAKLLNVVEDDMVFNLELRDSAPPHGKLIVEMFSADRHLLFPAQVGAALRPDTVSVRGIGSVVEHATDTDLNIFLAKVPVEFKLNYRTVKTFAVAGGEGGMAIELTEAIPAQTTLAITVIEDERRITTEGYVTVCHARGKGFLAIFRFAGLSRVEMMYWNRLVRTA
jgi:hypothetical protein